MFKAEISIENEKYFQAIWKLLPNLALEAEFSVSDNGILIRAIDPAQTAMVTIELPKAFFETLTCDNAMTFISDVLHVGKLIKSRGEKIQLYGDSETLTIEHIAKEYKRSFKSINLKGVTVTYPTLNLERDASFAIKSDFFQGVLEDATPVADTFYLSSDGKKLKIASEGELSTMEQEIDQGSILQGFKSKGAIKRAEYFHEYVKNFVDALYSIIDLTHVLVTEGKPLVLIMAATAEDKKDMIFKITGMFGPKP
jgi:proliferating cell nuclear antigen